MERRRLRINGPEVGALGLGRFGMSHAYGKADYQDSIRTIHRALDLGCNLLDTADEYGAGENERLLAEAIKGRRRDAVIATKFGFVWNSRGAVIGVNGRPEYVRRACELSLRRLDTEYIDLYYLHRVDPKVPMEETVAAMAELVREGKVRHLGLSEASAEQIRSAHAVHPITALQSEYSLWSRDPESEVLPTCRALGISFVAFSPLGRGFFTGQLKTVNLGEDDFRTALPRFQQANFDQNMQALMRLITIAERKQCSPAQLALSWVLAQGEDIVAIPGTRSINHLEENVAAAKVRFTPSELSAINAILRSASFAGARYNETSVFRPD